MIYHGLNDKRLKTVTFPFEDGSHPTYYIPAEASDLINNSTASGATVKDALDTIDSEVLATLTQRSAKPGSIVTFEDGADDIPLRHLEFDVECTQDLHGYDNPWPGGGGTNIFDPYSYFPNRTASGLTSEIMSDGTIHISGTATAENRYGTSTRFDFPAGTYIVVGAPQQVIVRDANGIISNNGVFTVDGETPIYFSVKVTNGETYDFYEKIQLNTGSDAIDWTPYANICPITGYTGAEVTRTGKNLMRYPYNNTSKTAFGITWTDNGDGSVTVNGTATADSDFTIVTSSENVPLANGDYIFSSTAIGTVPSSGFYLHVKANESDESYINTGIGQEKIYSISNNILYAMTIRVANGTTVSNVTVYPMIRRATEEDDSFEPYKGNTYSISFPSSAGTVYGGRVTIEKDGSGTLVVDKGVYDLGNITWDVNSNSSRHYYYYNSSIIRHAIANNVILEGLASSSYITGTYLNAYNNAIDYCIGVSGGGRIAIYDPLAKQQNYSAAQFKEYITGVQLVFPLATPITYTLDPVQVKTLLGLNNIWADTGDITALTYYEGGQFVNSGGDAIANKYSNASTYEIGDYVMHDGKLYRAAADISIAEEWTADHWNEVMLSDDVGNLTEEISDLKSAIADLDDRVDILEALEKGRGFTPEQLQTIAASGHANEYFEVGDIIYIDWTDYTPATPVTYHVPHVVTHFGEIEDENGVKHQNAMYLMWMYATPQTIQFDHPETIIVDEETFQDGFYYYTKNTDNSFTEQTVTVGDPIPAGTTYYKHVRTGMAGRIRYGSNDWSQSAYRQWLNSAGGKGEWWTAQHESDVAPDQASTVPGFLTGYSSDWLAIFKPIKVQTALNTACDGGVTVTTYDKFFLPSLEQMYGSPQAGGVEGEYWEYWKNELGLDAPTNGSSSNTNDARKIPSITAPSGAAVNVRLRSAYRSTTSYVWLVYTAGYLNSNGGATTAYRAQPACVIY